MSENKKRNFNRGKVSIILVFLMLTAYVFSINILADTQDTYRFSSGFSSTQGLNQWYYKQWNGSSYSDMTWDLTNGYWKGAQSYCIVGNWWAHPDTNDAVIAWKAPKSGTITVRGHMEHSGNHDLSDGVKTLIKKNSTQVWPSSGTQDIMGGFMATHVFQVAVVTDDYIYFHLNKNSTITADTTRWDPVISYDDTPQYTLDKAELVMDPADINDLGISCIDTSLSVVNQGSKNDWYLSFNILTRESPKFNGPLNMPVETIVYSNRDPFTNDNNVEGIWWISNIYEVDENELLAFCHLEYCDTNGHWAIGLAYSQDGGYTFAKLGKIIIPYTQEATLGDGNITGVPFIIRDGYFYIYYREKGGIYGYNAVARALVTDVIAAARNNQVTAWNKYYNSGWTSAGLEGNFTPVMNIQLHHDNTIHGDAAYSTYFQKYVMAGYTHSHGRGVWLSFSSDGLCWEDPTYIQHGCTNNISLSPYQTIVNIDGTDNGVVGQSFYLYYSFTQDFTDIYNHLMKHVFRQKVTLNSTSGAGGDVGYGMLVPAPAPIPVNTAWNASMGFSSTQGLNSWNYYSWNGSAKTEMNWDSANSRWYGSEEYCYIGDDWQHPSSTLDSDRTWTAPQAMQVTITGTVNKVTTGGDGVLVEILKQGTVIWSTTIEQDDTTTKSYNLTEYIQAGKTITFLVKKRGTIYCDSTLWNPTITKIN